MSETREVKTRRTVFYVNRELLELGEGLAEVFINQARAALPDNLIVIGDPHVAVSRPLPEFEFGVDEETGETYRNPDAVIVDFRVVEK